MGHLHVRLRGFEIGTRNGLVRFSHSGRRSYRLGLAIGWYGEMSGLHLVGGLRVALVPHCGNFRLLASRSRSACLGHLRLAVTLLFDRSEERRVGKECRSRWSP